jgi:sigma-B regulation protein RsbU (phosphoserine phosphatase)
MSAVSNIHPHFVEVAAYRDTLQLVAAGKADAALLPRLYAVYHAQEFGVEKTDIMFSPSELRFAAPMGARRPILDALDRHLVQLKADKRSVYYRSVNVWIEGVRTLIFPKWLKPGWVLAGIAALVLWIGGMNLVLRWRVRVRTNALRATLAAQERIEGELRIAHNIQMGSVRRDFPAIPGYEMYGVLQPARAVGGDFYDWFFADADHLCFVLGDVSGKGVPAALLMAATKSLLNVTGRGNPHPGRMLETANRQILAGNETCMFVTVFCGVLDVRTGVICYSSAGHNPPVVVREGRRLEYLEEARSPPIGIDEDLVYEEGEVTLHPGDALLMYTDGVTEARNVGREMFSEEGLRGTLSRREGGSARDLVQGTLEDVKHFAKDAPQADDIGLLAIRHVRDGDLGVKAWFTLRGEMSEIARVSDRVLRLGRDRGLPDEVVADVRLALEEVVSNVIRHAYAGKGDREIHVQLGVHGDEISLEVQDEGTPFNPLEHPEPDIGLPAEERSFRGHGILLVKRVMDEVAYRLEGGRNLLVMKKRIPTPADAKGMARGN